MQGELRDESGTVLGTVTVPDGTDQKTISQAMYRARAIHEAGVYKVDPALVLGVMLGGEYGNPGRSPKGAQGPMQLMPGTAKELGVDPTQPGQNIVGGVRYLRKLLDQFGGREDLAVAAYNAGPGAVTAHKGIPPFPETQDYLTRTFAARDQFRQQNAHREPVESGPSVAEAASGATGALTPRAPARQDSLLAQAASSLAETAAGVLDLPDVAVGLLHGDTGPGPASRLIAPHLAAPPESIAGKAVRAATGPAALFAVSGGEGLVQRGVQGLIGAGSGIGQEVGGDVAETAGLPRPVGEVVGSLAVPGAAGVVQTASTLARNVRAAKEAVPIAEKGLATLEAETAERMGQVETGAREAKAAEDATVVRTAQRTEQLESEARARLERANADAAARAETASFVAGEAVNAHLTLLPAEEKAALLRATIQPEALGTRKWVEAFYQDFLGKDADAVTGTAATPGRFGAVPVSHARLDLTPEELIDRMVAGGLSTDQAARKAQAILKVAEMPDLSFRQAHWLRSELGALYRKAPLGPTKARGAALYGALSQSMQEALPADAWAEYQQLGQLSKHEVRVYRNRMVRKLLDDSPEGADVAIRYTAGLLRGRWTAGKASELRGLLEAAGHKTVAQEIVKDAVLVHGLDAVTSKDGVIDFDRALRVFTNRDGFAPAFQVGLPNASERSRLLGFFREAAQAKREAAASVERLRTGAAEAHATARMLNREAGATARAAKAAIRSAEREAATAREQLVAGARASLEAAKAGAPTPLSVFDKLILGESAWHFARHPSALVGAPGAAIVLRQLFRWVRSGTNRKLLTQAVKTSADSMAGRRLLQTFVQLGARLRPEGGLLPAGPIPAAADPQQLAAP